MIYAMSVATPRRRRLFADTRHAATREVRRARDRRDGHQRMSLRRIASTSISTPIAMFFAVARSTFLPSALILPRSMKSAPRAQMFTLLFIFSRMLAEALYVCLVRRGDAAIQAWRVKRGGVRRSAYEYVAKRDAMRRCAHQLRARKGARSALCAECSVACCTARELFSLIAGYAASSAIVTPDAGSPPFFFFFDITSLRHELRLHWLSCAEGWFRC